MTDRKDHHSCILDTRSWRMIVNALVHQSEVEEDPKVAEDYLVLANDLHLYVAPFPKACDSPQTVTRPGSRAA